VARAFCEALLFAWQAQTNSLAYGGTEVKYTLPGRAAVDGDPDQTAAGANRISAKPSASCAAGRGELSRVWMILALTNFVQSEDELRAFQDRIFWQDKPSWRTRCQAPCR